jgi:hypothetical protein
VLENEWDKHEDLERDKHKDLIVLALIKKVNIKVRFYYTGTCLVSLLTAILIQEWQRRTTN